MVGKVAREDADTVVQKLHRLVIRGPRELDIAYAMSAFGYDAVKWAEGQELLAELVSSDVSDGRCLATAAKWYDEAVSIAQKALVDRPGLLAKLGVVEVVAS